MTTTTKQAVLIYTAKNVNGKYAVQMLTLKVNADWIAKVEDGRIGNVELKKIAQEAIPASDNLTVEDQHIDVMLKPEGTELPDKPNLTVVQ